MSRKLIPLAVALGTFALSGTVPAAPNEEPKAEPKTYTITFRAAQAGDKTEQTVLLTGKSEIAFGDTNQKGRQDSKTVFTEHVLDVSKENNTPTKLTRTYTTAREFDNKAEAVKPLAYEGKTVAIEKKGAGYEFTADDKKLDEKAAATLTHEFVRRDKGKDTFSDLLPKGAVKVGETWAVDLASQWSPAGDAGVVLDEAKSKATGKLAKVYTKDGRQWGVIALDFDLVIDSTKAKGKAQVDGTATGTGKMTGTLEGVIDGSARDLSFTFASKTEFVHKQGGIEFKATADMTITLSIRTVK